MKSVSHWHGLARLIFQNGLDLERAVRQPVRHLHVVGERKLRHQVRVTPEFQATGHASRTIVGVELRHLPVRRKHQQAVDRFAVLIAPQITEVRVQ